MQEEALFLAIGGKVEDSISGKMFGKLCFKVGKKAFTFLYGKEMVFKLTGEVHQEALSLDGTQLFDPSGKNRPMKEWVQVPYDYKDRWEEWAEESAKYVRTL